MKKKGTLLPEDLIFWGDKSLTRHPIMPEGMQMVDMNNIVDYKDLDVFKEKFYLELNYIIQDKMDIVQKDMEKANDVEIGKVYKILNANKMEQHKMIADVVNIDMKNSEKAATARVNAHVLDLDTKISNTNKNFEGKFKE